jgi:hypothetical protein
MMNHSHDSWSLGQNLNLGLPEYGAGMLPSCLQCVLMLLNFADSMRIKYSRLISDEITSMFGCVI